MKTNIYERGIGRGRIIKEEEKEEEIQQQEIRLRYQFQQSCQQDKKKIHTRIKIKHRKWHPSPCNATPSILCLRNHISRTTDHE